MDSENIPQSEIFKFVKKISDIAGPSSEMKNVLEELKTLVDNSDWSKVLTVKPIIDQDHNVAEAYIGKLKALVGLNKFSEARTALTIIPSNTLDKAIKDLTLHIDVSEKAFNSIKDIDKLKNALKDNPTDTNLYRSFKRIIWVRKNF